MPKNKYESLIYSVLMCFCMVLWMSGYNVFLRQGVSLDSVGAAWMGFPFAYVVALFLDMALVSKVAKAVTFRWIVKPGCKPIRIVLSISSLMVVQMVVLMSLYGACEGCVHTGAWDQLPMLWLQNIPLNFVMALPLQLLIAGPAVRFLFRRLFPEGVITCQAPAQPA